jgi:hypothetical protein
MDKSIFKIIEEVRTLAEASNYFQDRDWEAAIGLSRVRTINLTIYKEIATRVDHIDALNDKKEIK